MHSSELLLICASAFLAVFVLLAILASLMRLITAVFPQKATASEAAMIAAVTSVMYNLYPGTKITKVEEIK